MEGKKHRIPVTLLHRLPALTSTKLLVSCTTAFGYWLVFPAISILVMVPYGRFFWPVFVILSVRSLRALENLGGHEGAHYNWLRWQPRSSENRQTGLRSSIKAAIGRKLCPRVNDLCANLFAGIWVFTSAQSFRKPHRVHHSRFGAPPDPCFARFEMFHLVSSRTSGTAQLLRALGHEYVPYVIGYWSSYSKLSWGRLVGSVASHGLVCFLGERFFPHFAIGWLLTVVLPFFFILPILRLWAESEEHSYDGEDEFDDTWSNVGLVSRFLVHPAGDAYHLAHHFVPTIPHFRMRSAHKLFCEYDIAFRNATKVRF